MKKLSCTPIIFTLIFSLGFVIHMDVQATNVEELPVVKKFINQMNKKHGFNKQELNDIFSKVTLREIVIKKAASPAEAMTWEKYQKIFLTENRIKKGAEFIHQNLDTLNRAHKDFGVAKEVIAAILGIETNYGMNKGNYLAINAIASLAFQPNRRQKFFTSELEHLLLMSREENIAIDELRGSYAGALGIAQFIPSSYRRLSIDYDGDNSRDLIHSSVDAIGSVGHYFKEHDWRDGEPVAEFISQYVPRKHISSSAYKPKSSLKFWQKRGIEVNYPDKSIDARIVGFIGKYGQENWMIYPNFYTITRYNRSKLYAMAVFQLSEKIRESYEASLTSNLIQ